MSTTYPPNKPVCPRCKRSVYRVHRHFLDHMVNLFVPVWRFRCSAADCDWEGNLRRRPPASEVRYF
jgi:hypothetical protein